MTTQPTPEQIAFSKAPHSQFQANEQAALTDWAKYPRALAAPVNGFLFHSYDDALTNAVANRYLGTKLQRAKAYLESIRHRHPEWVIKPLGMAGRII